MKIKALILALAAIHSTAWAENATDGENNGQELQTVHVTGKAVRYDNGYQPMAAEVVGGGYTRLSDVPRSVNVVTSAVLADRRPESLDEALQTVSGIRQANTLAGTLDAVVKRGFGDNRDNSVLRNGMQMSQTHIFSPTAERVEVLKGPSSVLYGVQDPGGVVNVVTKQPQYKSATSVEASIGSNNSRQFGFDSTGRIGNSAFAYRFIADHRQSDYWRDFGKIRQTTIAPSLRWKGENTTITASYEYLDYKTPFDRGTFLDSTPGANYGKPLRIPAKRRIDQPYNEQVGKNHMFQLSIDHYLNEQWKLRFNYGYTYHTYDDWKARITQSAAGINTTTGDVRYRIDGTQDAGLRVHNVGFSLQGDLMWGSVRHKLSIGLEAMRNSRLLAKVYQSNRTYTNNMYAPSASTVRPIPGVNTFDGYGGNTQQTELLKTVSLSVNDVAYLNDKWILSGGVRVDYYDQMAGRMGYVNPRAPNAAARYASGLRFYKNTDNSGWNVSPQIGAVYRMNKEWSLYGSYASSFRPQVSIASEVPSNAQPEKGRAFEIGAKYTGARISGSVAAFHIIKRNVRYTAANDVRFAGRARSYGLEAEVGGLITDKLGVNANYAYTETKTLEGEAAIVGLPLNNTPRHQFGAYLTYDFGKIGPGNLRGGIGAKYNGSWHVGKNVTTGERTWKIPSAVVADAFLAYNVPMADNRNLSLRLNAKNLTNRQYFTSATGNYAEYPMVAYGRPREISLTAKFEF